MVPCCAVGVVRTSGPVHDHLWTAPPDPEPVTVLQTLWPCFPLTLSYEVPVPRASYPDGPRFYHPVTEKQRRKDNRKFILHRSLFDLVAAHPYLPLTDPKLLGWYLRLSTEDRKIILDEGGFHQFMLEHPALELSRHHVYVKQTPHMELEVLPSNMRDTLTLLGRSDSRTGPQEQLCEEIRGQQPVRLQDGFHAARSSPITEDADQRRAHGLSSTAASYKHPAELARFSLDMELQSCRQKREPELRTSVTRGQSAEVGPSLVHTDGPENSDGSIQSEERQRAGSPPGPVQENAAKEKGQDYVTRGDEHSVDDDQSDRVHRIMQDDRSILICVAGEDRKAQSDSSDTSKSEWLIEVNAAEQCPSPMPRLPTCDVMVGTEPALHTPASTQTEEPETADKHVVTEVHMTDLDYLTEEFIKLKMSHKVKEQEEKMKSSSCQLRTDCDCIQRTQQAELRLLALQYIVCRQHCWRLYYMSAEGKQLAPTAVDPPANITGVLQTLKSDYNHMKHQILAGVPLEQLKPLSVDSEKIATGASCSPAQFELMSRPDAVMSPPLIQRISHEPQNDTSAGDDPDHRSSCQVGESKVKKENKRRAVTLVPQDRRADFHAHASDEKQTTAACEEASAGEAWYDAEEELELSAQFVSNTESARVEAEGSVLRVCSLPSDGTELMTRPPLGSNLKNRKVVCISPTAKGTCVPQHYGTMGSFDTLMAELTQRHPDAGRQRIVDALLELREKHHGVLSGLPLRTIREMTSDLLSGPTPTTQS